MPEKVTSNPKGGKNNNSLFKKSKEDYKKKTSLSGDLLPELVSMPEKVTSNPKDGKKN